MYSRDESRDQAGLRRKVNTSQPPASAFVVHRDLIHGQLRGKLVTPARFERAALGLGIPRSILLSYGVIARRHSKTGRASKPLDYIRENGIILDRTGRLDMNPNAFAGIHR
jgi:hypothetical protein